MLSFEMYFFVYSSFVMKTYKKYQLIAYSLPSLLLRRGSRTLPNIKNGVLCDNVQQLLIDCYLKESYLRCGRVIEYAFDNQITIATFFHFGLVFFMNFFAGVAKHFLFCHFLSA